MLLTKFLGVASLLIGAGEIASPARLASALGLPAGPWTVRAFGVREIAAGAFVLARPASSVGPAFRLAGDALDLALLAAALRPRNPRRGAAAAAFGAVLGITLLDVLAWRTTGRVQRQA